MQRALLQYNHPRNYELVREALVKCHRTDLIGKGPHALIREKTDERGQGTRKKTTKSRGPRERQKGRSAKKSR